MTTIETRYGPLGPVDHVETGLGGAVLSCVPAGPVSLDTPFGRLAAQFSTDDMRRPKVEPIAFHPDGTLRSIALEEPAPFATPLGVIRAELASFHADGSLRRLFPVNGKLSAYWSEKEEATLNAPLAVDTPAGMISARLVGLHFFPSGRIRSLTLWPGETVEINTPLGRQAARIGVSFFESGALRSFEPERMVQVPTPLGAFTAFDPDALGIHGDLGSLAFHQDGSVAALASPLDVVEVTLPDGSRRVFAPGRTPNLCDENVMDISPLRIFFHPGRISFGQDQPESFPLAGHRFAVGRAAAVTLAPIAYACGA